MRGGIALPVELPVLRNLVLIPVFAVLSWFLLVLTIWFLFKACRASLPCSVGVRQVTDGEDSCHRISNTIDFLHVLSSAGGVDR